MWRAPSWVAAYTDLYLQVLTPFGERRRESWASLDGPEELARKPAVPMQQVLHLVEKEAAIARQAVPLVPGRAVILGAKEREAVSRRGRAVELSL